MRRALVTLTCAGLVLVAAGFAQEKQPAKPKTTLAATLEARVRQAWADCQLKKKTALAAVLTDDFTMVEEDGAGPRDKKSQLDEVDRSNLSQYALTEFKVKPIGADSALVMYTAEYSRASGPLQVRDKVLVGEIWIRRGGAWKRMYAQMTRMS